MASAACDGAPMPASTIRVVSEVGAKRLQPVAIDEPRGPSRSAGPGHQHAATSADQPLGRAQIFGEV
jgi:hypothetical protein